MTCAPDLINLNVLLSGGLSIQAVANICLILLPMALFCDYTRVRIFAAADGGRIWVPLGLDKLKFVIDLREFKTNSEQNLFRIYYHRGLHLYANMAADDVKWKAFM